ncbi:hypothetical protein N9361_01935 [Alphaproteobacteria bacterium]|nr:hypothetical protein [Alphaproteobacteria bacterium]
MNVGVDGTHIACQFQFLKHAYLNNPNLSNAILVLDNYFCNFIRQPSDTDYLRHTDLFSFYSNYLLSRRTLSESLKVLKQNGPEILPTFRDISLITATNAQEKNWAELAIEPIDYGSPPLLFDEYYGSTKEMSVMFYYTLTEVKWLTTITQSDKTVANTVNILKNVRDYAAEKGINLTVVYVPPAPILQALLGLQKGRETLDKCFKEIVKVTPVAYFESIDNQGNDGPLMYSGDPNSL